MKTNQILATAVAAFLTLGAYAQTVDEIVDKHVAALGGLDKLNAVKTISSKTSISVQGMEIPTEMTVVRGKAMRSESTIMGNSMIQVIDGQTGWMVRPAMMGGTGDPEDMPADQLKQQADQLDPFGALVNYKDKGYTVELVGKEKVDNKDTFHLKLTKKDGTVADQYLDATTYLMSKAKRDMNGQAAEVMVTEYQTVDGIKVPKSMDISSPMGQITMTTEKVTINGPVDEAIFKKPAK